MNFFFAMAWAGLSLFGISVTAQNLLINGSFEIGTAVNSLRAGDTNLPGWTISGPRSLNRVSTNGFNPLTPPDGNYYVDLNGAGGGIALSQSFATAPGETYAVSFTVGTFRVPDTS